MGMKMRNFMIKTNRGFSMMELLVAVLVMGIGVLSVTGLQMISLQDNQDALRRSEALQLAYEIMDRIRVNPGIGVPGIAYDGVGLDDLSDAPPDCVATNCSANQMVDFDLALWKCSLGGHNADGVCTDLREDVLLPAIGDQPGLPNGQGQIEVDASGRVTVTIQWLGFNNVERTVTVVSQG
jgi:type IV pilus assembly protein PilV